MERKTQEERDKADKKYAFKWTEWAWYIVITAISGAVLTALIELVIRKP